MHRRRSPGPDKLLLFTWFAWHNFPGGDAAICAGHCGDSAREPPAAGAGSRDTAAVHAQKAALAGPTTLAGRPAGGLGTSGHGHPRAGQPA